MKGDAILVLLLCAAVSAWSLGRIGKGVSVRACLGIFGVIAWFFLGYCIKDCVIFGWRIQGIFLTETLAAATICILGLLGAALSRKAKKDL